MLKSGDRVSLFHNIGKEGVIIKIFTDNKSVGYYTTDGTVTKIFYAQIKWDSGDISNHKLDDVMPIK